MIVVPSTAKCAEKLATAENAENAENAEIAERLR
jgi:hypothetical protein